MNEQNETDDTIGDVHPWSNGADLKEGTRIDRYQLLGLLGKGGMGAVYKAYDPELDRSIAIKVLTAKPQEGETASRPQARLMREAQALAKLSHPNVVSIFDVGTYEEGIYIAMEYVKGKTLREWLRDTEATQKEIIEVLSKAGEGLQSAHTEGIVHRDFKPDNVIVGDNGQVKVLDFGLARAAEIDKPIFFQQKPETPQQTSSSERILSTPLTRIGATIGTTVYMAPEHFLGDKLDEKTDQFSFCVTLFEALYGKRPFLKKTIEDLKTSITTGSIEIPEKAKVPRWIEDITLKGLSVKKENRYQSMVKLLDALSNDPEILKAKRRKKFLSTSLLIVLTALTFGFGYFAFFKSSKVCTGSDKKIAGIWDNERKEKIRQSFAKTGLFYANDSFVRVEKRFGVYLQKWKDEYTETCKATRIQGEQSEEIMDLRMGCLNKHLMNAASLAKVLGEADKTVVEKSVQAVSSLSGFSNCNNLDALRSKIQPPKDEITKTKVIAIREKLAEVEALEKTGKYRGGLALVRKLEEQSNTVGYQPVRAEVMYHLGGLLEKSGEYKEAEIILNAAGNAAGKSRDGLLAAKSLAWLVWIVGYRQARHDAGLSIARDTEILLRVAGGDDTVLALLFNNKGAIFYSQANYDKALECYAKSLEIRKKVLGPKHPFIANPLNNMGIVFKEKGEYDKAHSYFLKALKIWKTALGPNHPLLAAYYNSLGSVFSLKGLYDRALEYYRLSLAISEKELGSDHLEVAKTLNNMGNVFAKQGENEKVFDCYRRSLAIKEKALGAEHPHVARTLDNMGAVYAMHGKYEKSLEYHRKALAIREKTLGTQHPLTIESLSSLGRLFINLGKPQQSLKPLERVVRFCEIKDCYPDTHGLGLFDLARALIGSGADKIRAITLAKQSRTIFEKTPKRFKKELEELDGWLTKYERGKGKDISTAKH